MAFADDNTEQIVRRLQFALTTALPVLTVAGALAGGTIRRITPGRSIWSNIITDDDLEEELARSGKIDQAAAGSAESTPLLSSGASSSRRRARTVKSATFVLIGAFELVARVGLFFSTSRSWHGRHSIATILSCSVWLYATLLPLLQPPDRAPLSLFIIYLLSFPQAIVDLYILTTSESHFPLYTVSRILYVGHLCLCLLGIVVALGMPLHPPPVVFDPQSEDAAPPALDDHATLGQWLTIRWVNPLIQQANSGPLEVRDIREIAVDARAGLLTRKFAPLWPNRSLLARLFLANLGDISLNFAIGITRAILHMLQPILLHRILNSLEYRAAEAAEPLLKRDYRAMALLWAPEAVYRRDARSAYFFAAIAFAAMVLNAHLGVLGSTLKRRMVQRARAEAVGTLYTKALKRIDTAGIVDPNDANAETRSADLGKLVSLVSVDVVRLGLAPIILDVIGETPLTIVVAGWFLYSLIGYSAFVGYATFIVFLPMSYHITTTMMVMNRAVMAQRDLRMKSINELIQSIKFIKFSAWETRWIQRVLVAREKELSQLFKAKVVQAVFSLMWKVVPIIIAAINLSWFTGVAGKQLTVAIAFPAILALAMLTNELNSIPTAFSFYGRLMAGFQRMDEFLSEEEVPDWVSKLKSSEALSAQQFDIRVGAVDGNFSWFQSSHAGEQPAEGASSAPDSDAVFQLRNINALFPRGRLSIIAGPTGSGKSSLLAALLGEMKCLSGTVLFPKFSHRVDPATGLSESASFCTQHPWLQSKTIRENILFGSPFDAQRYNAVLEACALVQDLDQFENGDATEVGDKGIVLSGGQKARVALARAVYARSQIVVLDDVLSAVDTHTASTLIRKCFRGPLMQGRTVILVTHHLGEIVDTAAWVVKMEHGAIAVQGTPGELRASGLLAELIKAEEAEEAKREHEEEVVPRKEDEDEDDDEDEQPAKKLVEAETKASGSVRMAIYLRYFKAASWWIVVIFLSCYLFESLAHLVQQIWIKIWSESYDKPVEWRSTPFGFPPASQSVLPYVVVYISLQVASLLLIFGGVFPSIWSSQRAARKLFKQMLDAVVRSPTRFFDKTPAGRVLNRFSKDIDQIDNSIQDSVNEALTQLIAVIVAVATVAYGIPPYIFALVILVWLHVYFARGYVPASRDLGRLSSITQSPMLTILGETLQGLTTIRAFGSEFQFLDTLFQRLDKFHSALYYEFVCDFWLRYRFDMLGAVSFGISAATAIYMDLSAGLAAIVLTQAESILQNIYYGLQYYVQMETSMNAMERVEEYIELPAEPPRHVSNIPAHWPPASPSITFENVSLRYAPDLDPVLREVSFTVKPGEKIGICGRTGSGKSTLAMSLFRFVDPDAGRILVGDMDITSLGVEDLRSCLTLIPQDAVLFSGTIRDNLDPFNEHTDAECLSALSMVHLTTPGETGTDETARMSITLETKVSEGGANFSAGQRQLLALARALLRDTGIMVLDESTASVDFDTDRKIQMTIRERLAGKVLLTIAHRLHTVIDYDRIVVLQDGRVVEFDTPAALIAKEGGVFRGMCVQSGHFAELVAAARGSA